MPQMFVRSGAELVAMDEAPFASEAELQQLLAETPDLMPGEPFDGTEPRRWLLVTREAGVALDDETGLHGSLDHLFLDQDGVLTLVEVKRSTDTRIRREVVGQLLDYAAALGPSTATAIRARFEAHCAHEEVEPSEALAGLLGPDNETTAEEYWARVETNLRAGRLRLVFVADRIPAPLRRIIEFLSEQFAQTEVVGVEIRQWQSADGMIALTPTVVGTPTRQRQAREKTTPRRTHEDFLAALRTSQPEAAPAIEAVIGWIRAHGGHFGYGTSATDPACIVRFDVASTGKPVWPIAFYPSGNGYAAFQWIKSGAPFDDETRREEFRQRLNEVPGIDLPADSLGGRPKFPLTALIAEPARAAFIGTMEWFLVQVRATT